MPQLLLNLIALLYGLCFGSFANVLIYRLPRKESLNNPPSHCPACHKQLSALDLIPVLSWIFLRGRCHYCKVRISIQYPAVEVACAGLFMAMALYTGVSLSLIPLCLLAFVLLCVSVIDGYTQEIPDGLLIFGTVVGLLWVLAGNVLAGTVRFGAPFWPDALLGVLAGALPLWLIDRLALWLVKKDGFGFGDVKLMAMAGLFLGWRLTLVSFFFAFIIGGIFGAFLIITKRAERGSYLAFGPFLSVGIVSSLYVGKAFIDWMFI